MCFVQDLCSQSENSPLSIKNINRFCLLSDMGAEGLKKFLTFLTGLEEVPPLGFSKKIEVKYLKDRTQTLYAETCTMVLKLPTVHTEYSLFKAQFMLACNEGSLGFACA